MRLSSRKGIIAAGLLLGLLLVPLSAQAGIGNIFSLLASIRGTLTRAGKTLGSIQAIERRVRDLEKRVIWPPAAIAEARARIGQLRTGFSPLSRQIRSIQIGSATLGNPGRLERLLRGRTSRNLNQLAASYAAVYLALPQANQATERQRNLIDIDDAFALEVLKAASISDRAGESALKAADRLEQEAVAAAPGSAGILAAGAQASDLGTQAMLQKMLAAQLREEAALLAHRNALRKQSAESLKQMRNNLLDVLGRR